MTTKDRMSAGSTFHTASCGLVVAVLCAVLSARAQTDLWWQNTGGGTFEVDQNWDPEATPGTDTNAIFDLKQASPYTVSLAGNNTISAFQAREDRLMLDLAGNTLSLTRAHTWGYLSPGDGGRTGLELGAYGDSLLTITNSNAAAGRKTVSTTGLGLGANGYAGHLVLDGATTRLHVTSSDATLISTNADTSLTIRNGAWMESAGIFDVGYTGTAFTATILVEGAGSELRSNTFRAGERGAVDITIRDGANFRAGSYTYLSRRDEAVTMTIDNATASSVANLHLGDYRAEGKLRLINGGKAHAGGGHVAIGAAMASGSNTSASGVLEVIGQGSQLTQTRVDRGIAIGGYHTTDKGTRGDLTIRDGGDVTNVYNVWIHSRGTLTISAGTLNVGNDLLVTDGVGVTHGETVEPTFNLTLHAGLTAAPVNVASNAVLGLLNLNLDLAPGFDAEENTVFEILQYGGTLDGTFLGLADQSTVTHGSGYEFLLDYGSGTNDAITLTVTQIPEPGTLALLLGAGALLALRRRRGTR